MATPERDTSLNEDRNLGSPRSEERSTIPNDLPDSPEDQRKLQPEDTVINLPDVSDIPGQENVTVPRMESFADVTPASADEEGEGIFDDADYNDSTAHTSMGQGEERGDDNAVENTP